MKKKGKKEQELLSSNDQPMSELRNELQEGISRRELEQSWRLEALDRIFTASELDPETFQRLWIYPLLRAGLSRETAIARIVDCFFQPN